MDDAELDAVLERLAAGELTVPEARERLRGVVDVGGFARVDTRRAERTGVPAVVGTDRKSRAEAVAIAEELLAETGRAILADVEAELAAELDAADHDYHGRSGTLVARATEGGPPADRGRVAVLTAGTADRPVAEEAVVLAREMGCTVEVRHDVGVSGLHRLLGVREALAAADCVVAAAGREGALATVTAGLTDAPVVGLPVGTGEGAGGDGEAALLGMLQSCTYLSVVNVDAGFAAGAQAALVAD